MSEKAIEKKLCTEVKKSGGICPKFTSPSYDGMPDRLVLLPSGKIGFVEVKSRGVSPTPLQKRRLGMLSRLGFQVFVLDDIQQIGGIIHAIQTA
jgi:hypothetical protein